MRGMKVEPATPPPTGENALRGRLDRELARLEEQIALADERIGRLLRRLAAGAVHDGPPSARPA